MRMCVCACPSVRERMREKESSSAYMALMAAASELNRRKENKMRKLWTMFDDVTVQYFSILRISLWYYIYGLYHCVAAAL